MPRKRCRGHFLAAVAFGLLLPATHPSASPKTASGFWHPRFFSRLWDALGAGSKAAPWWPGKTNEPRSPYQPWEDSPNRFCKGMNSVLLQSSVWKLALVESLAAGPLAFQKPKNSAASGKRSVSPNLSQKHVRHSAVVIRMLTLQVGTSQAHKDRLTRTNPPYQGGWATEQNQEGVLASPICPALEAFYGVRNLGLG